ncbi:MAG: L-seryl-tRNA(Sec) selenium transferase [Ilumatobacteraceae bacterium]
MGDGRVVGGRPPSVDALARRLAEASDLPAALLVDLARQAIAEGGARDVIVGRAENLVAETQNELFSEVINATGVLLHTNLGRAPLAAERRGRAVNVEFDLDRGERGSRHQPISQLVAALTGAESAVVVNNNAAAMLLILAALAEGRGVAVSRGESVEIGGGFRVPEVMARSGARLVDVGTTNRTRIDDYRASIDQPSNDIAVLLRVHSSNFAMTGFVESTPVNELAELGPLVVVDLGSGLLDSNAPWLPSSMRPLPGWISSEPAVRQTLEAGADLVAFSGDKLLGGPQCGIIAGRAELVERCARHPLMRALRPGHHALLPLQDVLSAHLRRNVVDVVPFWTMVARTTDELMQRAHRIVDAAGVGCAEACESLVGAGAAPSALLPSAGVVVAGDVSHALRSARPLPIIARVADGSTVIDLRAVSPDDDRVLVDALVAIGG